MSVVLNGSPCEGIHSTNVSAPSMPGVLSRYFTAIPTTTKTSARIIAMMKV